MKFIKVLLKSILLFTLLKCGGDGISNAKKNENITFNIVREDTNSPINKSEIEETTSLLIKNFKKIHNKKYPESIELKKLKKRCNKNSNPILDLLYKTNKNIYHELYIIYKQNKYYSSYLQNKENFSFNGNEHILSNILKEQVNKILENNLSEGLAKYSNKHLYHATESWDNYKFKKEIKKLFPKDTNSPWIRKTLSYYSLIRSQSLYLNHLLDVTSR